MEELGVVALDERGEISAGGVGVGVGFVGGFAHAEVQRSFVGEVEGEHGATSVWVRVADGALVANWHVRALISALAGGCAVL